MGRASSEWHFWQWLNEWLNTTNISAFRASKRLRIGYGKVRRHLDGRQPHFIDIVGYCWLFKISNQIYFVWDKVKEEFNIEEEVIK